MLVVDDAPMHFHTVPVAEKRLNNITKTTVHCGRELLPEGVHITCFMLAGQSQLIAGAILADVLRVCLGKALNGCINGCHSPLFPHALCGEVGMRSST